MYRLFLKFIYLLGVFSLSFQVKENVDSVRHKEGSQNIQVTNTSTEKVYLHTDRNTYSSGESIWYKAYLVSGVDHIPSHLSQTIYVELLGPNGVAILKSKLYAEAGSASGDFKIPPYLETGNYVLRAYTQWMKNWDTDYFFHKNISIILPSDTFSINTTLEEDLVLGFFPEGGEMIEGIPGKVGVKVVNQFGKGKSLNGVIEDDRGNFVTQFTTNNLGMGIFYLRPSAGVKYQAKIEGHERSYPVPAAKAKGLTMSIDNLQEKDYLVLRLQSNEKHAAVRVIAQVRSQICFSAQVQMKHQGGLLQIPKEVFPPGVAQVSVLSEKGQPLAERLVFVNEIPKLQATVSTNKNEYTPREQVGLLMELKDPDGKPIQGDFSLSVVDQSAQLADDTEETIYEYLHLRSELRGYIQDPSYYFDSKNQDRWQALDYLMLTQGWRKFKLEELMNPEKKAITFPIERGLTFSGKLIEYDREKGIPYGNVSVLDMSGGLEAWELQTAEDGRFELRDIVLFDTCRLMFKGLTKKGGDMVRFRFDELISPSMGFPVMPLEENLIVRQEGVIRKGQIRNQIALAFDSDMRTIILDEVKITGEDERKKSLGSKIYGPGSVTIDVGENPHLQNLPHPMMLVVGRVPGVIMMGGQITIRGLHTLQSNPLPMILVDDIPITKNLDFQYTLNITGEDYLSSIPVYDIESVVVWKGPDAATFGSQGAGGVIGFYTKRGKGIQSQTPGVTSFIYQGYQVFREFYSPDYRHVSEDHIKPDHRVTLHWEPYIELDENGTFGFSFFNHDLEAKVKVKVEGITTDGRPVMGYFDYEVQKNADF